MRAEPDQPPILEPLQPNVSLVAYAALRDRLLTGVLPAGSVIQERRLAEALGFSRTPIREALQKLEGEGLLARQDRFLRVVEITVAEVMEILAVRQTLESDAARAASGRMSKALIQDIRDRIDAMANPGAVSDGAHWAVDDLLHLSIAKESGNGLLLRLISDLRQKTRLFGLHRIPSRFGPGKAEHFAILDAIEEGDGDLAAQRMTQHIGQAREGILRVLSGR